MRLTVIAVGQKIPAWAQAACDDYARRFPPEFKLGVKTVKAETRDGRPPELLMRAESGRIEAAMAPGSRCVALDERGDTLSTEGLARRLALWQRGGDDVALLIGGADGLDPELRRRAHERIRLSDLTLPHALARVLLLEQLYRAWSIHANHPYHRA